MKNANYNFSYALRRGKLDANREIEQAAQGWPDAEEAYRLYHDKCREVVDSVPAPGLIIDLHGNGHYTNRTELGYLLSKTAYKRRMTQPGSGFFPSFSEIFCS